MITYTENISTNKQDATLSIASLGSNHRIDTKGSLRLCNAAITYILENYAKCRGLWTFTQIRSHMDQNKLFKGLHVGKPSIYSWRNKSFK